MVVRIFVDKVGIYCISNRDVFIIEYYVIMYYKNYFLLDIVLFKVFIVFVFGIEVLL